MPWKKGLALALVSVLATCATRTDKRRRDWLAARERCLSRPNRGQQGDKWQCPWRSKSRRHSRAASSSSRLDLPLALQPRLQRVRPVANLPPLQQATSATSRAAAGRKEDRGSESRLKGRRGGIRRLCLKGCGAIADRAAANERQGSWTLAHWTRQRVACSKRHVSRVSHRTRMSHKNATNMTCSLTWKPASKRSRIISRHATRVFGTASMKLHASPAL